MYEMLAHIWGRIEHGTTCVQYHIPPKERLPSMFPSRAGYQRTSLHLAVSLACRLSKERQVPCLFCSEGCKA